MHNNGILFKMQSIYIYIYIYAFSRCFYPKRLTVHSGYTCFITMSVLYSCLYVYLKYFFIDCTEFNLCWL